jgi:hypothetical protein
MFFTFGSKVVGIEEYAESCVSKEKKIVPSSFKAKTDHIKSPAIVDWYLIRQIFTES